MGTGRKAVRVQKLQGKLTKGPATSEETEAQSYAPPGSHTPQSNSEPEHKSRGQKCRWSRGGRGPVRDHSVPLSGAPGAGCGDGVGSSGVSVGTS